MPTIATPAIQAFCRAFQTEFVFGQLLIQRPAHGFLLRHLSDRDRALETLRTCNLAELRQIAQWTSAGTYRPLRSAPTLQSGWAFAASDPQVLEEAINRVYPGALADWFAAQSPEPPVTNFRDFTRRQSGMYRMTHLLTDRQAGEVIRAGCHRKFCLKQRRWAAAEAPPDPPEEKSLIPCLEPCALLLEFARRGLRVAQEEAIGLRLGASDLAALHQALESAAAAAPNHLPEAQFTDPANPRRIQLAKEKLPLAPNPGEEPLVLQENI